MEIRTSVESDEEGIRALFSACFGKELSHEEWVWKYRHSPWGSVAFVAVDDINIVAHYGGMKMKFLFEGKNLAAFQFCDVMTHPKYRARYVSKSPLIAYLGEMFYRENSMDFAFGFPSIRHARLQTLRLGGEGYTLVKAYKKTKLRRYLWRWKFRVQEGWEYVREEEFYKFLRVNDDSVLSLIKDSEYIRWRYRDNPSRKYSVLILRKDNKVKGYVVFTQQDGWLNFMEFLYRDKRDLKMLFISAEAYLASTIDHIKGIKGWFHPQEDLSKIVESLGYQGSDDIPVAFKTVNAESGISSQIFYRNYCYRMGDYDAA